jgi:acyl carrier protein
MAQSNVPESEVLERFAAIVASSLRIDRARVTPDAYLSDLGAESLDLLEISMAIEDDFGVQMPQKDILNVAQEVCGQDVLVQEGRLTEEGVRFLQRRTLDGEGSFTAGMPVSEVYRSFQRVGTWVRMIHGLLPHLATSCPSCGAALGKAVAGRQTCSSCAAHVDLPAGDDLNRRWVEEYFRGGHGIVQPGGEQFA